MKPLKAIYAPLAGVCVEQFLYQQASTRDFDMLIKSSCKVNLEGRPPIIYIANADKDLNELVPHLQKLNYSPSQRVGLGNNNTSILFGAVPPEINKKGYCSYGAVADHNDTLYRLLTNKSSNYLQGVLDTYLPGWSQVWKELYKRKGIHEDYRLADTIWTSGIINQNSPHHYHYDDMNVSKMISAMMTFKSGVEGGYLCFPEYRIAFEVKNQSLIYFSGKHILHGVTPIELDKGGYRTSVVYYTTDAVKKCASQKEEAKKARKK